MITDEGMKRLVEAAAVAGISTAELDGFLDSIPASMPVDSSPENMTTEEALQFCRERDVVIISRYDFITDTYIIRMWKGQRATETRITAQALFEAHPFPYRSILTQMADELDAMPPEPPEACR